MYYSSFPVGDIYVTSRSSTAAAFAPGAAIGALNSSELEGETFQWRDGEVLYLVSDRPGGAGQFDIWVSTRTGAGSYGPSQAVVEINSPFYETQPVVTSDGLTIYWASNRANGPRCRRVAGTRCVDETPLARQDFGVLVLPESDREDISAGRWSREEGHRHRQWCRNGSR
jgi:hypothetical protein